MELRLHKNAATTPRIRREIQQSSDTSAALARRYGVTLDTISRWRDRDTVEDGDHTPHRLNTTLTPAQEAILVELRKDYLISLDDLLALAREFVNPKTSRAGLSRCLTRHGVGNLRDMKKRAPKKPHGSFKDYDPGYLHLDVKYLPQMAGQKRRQYCFVAIERATRWVFLRIYSSKTAANARRFLAELRQRCPIRIHTILTDNGKEFTDRLFGGRARAATGNHEFDRLCGALGIDHRLTPPRSPQTNGMVERFNGRIEEVLQSRHFHSGEDLSTTLHRFVLVYNQHLPQSALKGKTPMQEMMDRYRSRPDCFVKPPCNLPVRDN